MTALGLAVVRVALAAVFMAHGLHQLFGLFGGPAVGPGGLSATSGYFDGIGLSHSFALAVASGVIQLGGAALLLLGWFTRWTAAALALYVAAFAWKTQLQWGFFLNWVNNPSRGQGIEFSLVMAGVLVGLALAGGGDFSLDGRRASRAAALASGRARLRTRT